MVNSEITPNHIKTDDLALSAYLKMKGYRLIKTRQDKLKSIFTFDIGDRSPDDLKVEFVNSEFVDFHNEVRNLKKLVRNGR
jgi:hypothetical protein